MDGTRQKLEEPEPVTIVGDGPAIGSTGGATTEAAGSHSERVARRAYQRFEERGGEHGRDMEDWLKAERELTNQNDE